MPLDLTILLFSHSSIRFCKSALLRTKGTTFFREIEGTTWLHFDTIYKLCCYSTYFRAAYHVTLSTFFFLTWSSSATPSSSSSSLLLPFYGLDSFATPATHRPTTVEAAPPPIAGPPVTPNTLNPNLDCGAPLSPSALIRHPHSHRLRHHLTRPSLSASPPPGHPQGIRDPDTLSELGQGLRALGAMGVDFPKF
jgi:hypothetical protein